MLLSGGSRLASGRTCSEGKVSLRKFLDASLRRWRLVLCIIFITALGESLVAVAP